MSKQLEAVMKCVRDQGKHFNVEGWVEFLEHLREEIGSELDGARMSRKDAETAETAEAEEDE